MQNNENSFLLILIFVSTRLTCRIAVPLSLVTDSYVTTQHALPQNISQFETPALPQPAFDQQSLTQGTNTNTHQHFISQRFHKNIF